MPTVYKIWGIQLKETLCTCWLSKLTQIIFPTSSFAFLITFTNTDLVSLESPMPQGWGDTCDQ